MKKNKGNANASQQHEFQSALSQNGEASNFYENCTSAQKTAIQNQLHNINSGEQMQAFVDHLPSQTL